MDLIKINAKVRDTKGNGPARVLRGQGRIPAVLYGPGKEPVNLSIDTVELEQALKGANIGQMLLNVTIDDGDTRTAMIRELQRKTLSRDLQHVDFYEISMDRKIDTTVPIIVTGKSIGVEAGGILQIIRRELEINCMPNAIPESIVLDVTDLDIGDSIHVKDIVLEGDIEISHEVNFTVVIIGSPKAAEEEEIEEEEGEELAEGAEGEKAEETEEAAEK